MDRQRILVVDDEPSWTETVELILGDAYDLEITSSPAEALSIFRVQPIPLAILDQHITPETSGLDLLTQLREIQPHLRAIILTGFAGIDDAVASMKSGAFDYLSKGHHDLENELRARVAKALLANPAEEEIAALLRKGESATLEFKSTLRWDLRQQKANRDLEGVVLKTVAAFLNSAAGGVLLLGVDDAGHPIGLQHDYETLKKKDRDGFEAFLYKLLLDAYGNDVAPFLQIDFAVIGSAEVCRVSAKPASKPVYVSDAAGKDRLYIRTGNVTVELSAREALDYFNIRWTRGSDR
jgi:ActR/RegA family two-component response regulator